MTDLSPANAASEADMVDQFHADAARIATDLVARFNDYRAQTARAVREGKPEGLLVARAKSILLPQIKDGVPLDDIIQTFVENWHGQKPLDAKKLRAALTKLKTAADKEALLLARQIAQTPPVPVTDLPTVERPPATEPTTEPRTNPAPEAGAATASGLTPGQAARVAELGIPTAEIPRLLAKPPRWAAKGYGQEYPELARGADESETDYGWRLWTTLPPWAEEFAQARTQKSPWDFLNLVWKRGSPRERAAHQASLPPTAR